MKLYKYYKTNCAPCYAMDRILNTMDIPSNIQLIRVNVEIEENKRDAKEKGINSVPVLLFEDGRMLSGSKSREEIINFIGGVI